MRFELHLWNCLWLILPLLIWNLLFGPRIKDERITSDAFSPKWLLLAENIMRIFVFMLPLLIPLKPASVVEKFGLWVYIIGTLIYFASWVPLLLTPHSNWCNSAAGLLAPRLTPFLPFLGIALIGENITYAATALVFIGLHTWHGVQNYKKFTVVGNQSTN